MCRMSTFRRWRDPKTGVTWVIEDSGFIAFLRGPVAFALVCAALIVPPSFAAYYLLAAMFGGGH